MPNNPILLEVLKQLGVSSVLAAILIFYYQGETSKWEARQKIDEERWRTLFVQYTQDQKTALETIRTCCRERAAQYLESQLESR